MTGYTGVVVLREPVFESLDCMTQDEFAVWAERAEPVSVGRYELINGRVVMSPPAGYPHGEVEARIVGFLLARTAGNGRGKVFGSSQGFALPSGDTLEPDASYVSAERWAAGPEPADGQFVRVVPDMVVEIVSPSSASRDRGEKKAVYERNGVREYWVVDPRSRRIVRFSLADGRFDLGAVLEEDGALSSTVLGGSAITVSDLLGT